MKKILAIIGSGDLGQQIAHYAINDNHYRDVVFFDDFSVQNKVNGYKVLGESKTISKCFLANLFDEIIIAIGYKHISQKSNIFKELINNKIPLGTIIHSTCWVDPSANIEKGCVIYPGCFIDAQSIVKSNSILNINCTIAHDTIIHEHCFLSPRVAIAGFVTINQKCILGINCTVIDNLQITSNTQIGAASLVLKSITESGTYVGYPLRKLNCQR